MNLIYESHVNLATFGDKYLHFISTVGMQGLRGANPVGVHRERIQALRKGREMVEVNKIDRQVK